MRGWANRQTKDGQKQEKYMEGTFHRQSKDRAGAAALRDGAEGNVYSRAYRP